MTFSLRPREAVDLAVDRGFGEHLRRLLEGGRRDEALGRERRLGDAEQQRLGDRRLRRPSLEDALVLLLEAPLLDLLADQELGVADLLDADAAQHLPHDDLDVLVVDAHALEAVDLLDLVDQVLRERLLAEDRAGCRAGSTLPSISGSPARTKSPSCTLMCLPFGIRYSRGSPISGRDDDLALALRVLAERHDAVDLA